MKIDGNEYSALELKYFREGQIKESEDVKKEFLRKIKESGIDHCNCPNPCIHHGNCYECVILHRGHRDHLPYCLWDMVNERLEKLSLLTEDSYVNRKSDKKV